MKISKRIFSFLVSLLMITSSVGVATATETADTTNGATYHIDISSDFNMDGIASVGDTLTKTTWMNGTTYGFPASLFTAENGLVKFDAKSLDKIDPNGKVEKANLQSVAVPSTDNAEFLIPQEGLKGGVNDNVFIVKNTEKTFTLKEGATNIDKIRIALHMYSEASFTFTVNYSDNTSDIVNTDGDFQASLRNADWNAVNWYIGKPVRRFCWKWGGSSIVIGEENKATKSTAGSTDWNWGIAGYQIPVDSTKSPVSLTVKATNPISVFAINECQLYNEEMKFVVDEVKAYGTGIAYTTAQIEKIELAKKYLPILEERNAISSEDKATVDSLYTVSQKQKDLAGTIYLDITDKLNASTIGSWGETAEPETWFKGVTDKQYGDEKSGKTLAWTKLGLRANVGAFNTSSDYISMQKYDNKAAVSGETVSAYIPASRRTASALDSRIISHGDESFTVDLKNVNSKEVAFTANTYSGNPHLNVTVTYTDGTKSNNDLLIPATGLTYSNLNSWNLSHVRGIANIGNQFSALGDNNILVDHRIGLGKDDALDSLNKSIDIVMYKVDTDEDKIPQSITFDVKSENGAVIIYAINQNPITLSEMTTVVNTAKELETKVGLMTAEEVEAIKFAKKYVPILIEAGVGTEADYAFLDTVLAKANNHQALSGLGHIDISDKYNADTIASEGDTVGESWFAGFDNSDTNKFGNFGGFTKGGLNDKEIFQANTYSRTQTGTDADGKPTYSDWSLNGEKVEVYIPNVGRNGGENDAFALKDANSNIEVKLNEVYTKSVRYLFHSGDSTIKWIVYYKDGTTEEAQKWYNSYASHYYGDRTGIPMLNTIGGNFLFKGTDNKLTSKGGTVGMLVHKIALDETKIPDKIVFSWVSSRPTFLYSVSQETVSYDEMTKALEAGLESGVMTNDDEATLEKLKEYNNLLVGMGAIASDTYGTKIANYEKQANAQKTSYVDLSKYVNADLMVKTGDTYSDTNATLARKNVLFNGANLTGMLTVKAPSKEYATDADKNEVGRTYKLSGAYNGKGNDVVQVKKDNEAGKNTVTISLPETVGTVNGIGVILDCYTGAGGADDATKGYATKVPVTINYTDKTSETKNVNLLSSEGFYYSKFYANAGNVGRLDYSVDMKLPEGAGNSFSNYQPVAGTTEQIRQFGGGGYNSPYFYSSNIAFDTTKTVESLTFGSITGGDYNIIAISQFVQTNEELVDIAGECTITKTEDITTDNVDEAIKGLSAYVELCDRGFAEIFEINREEYVALLDYAKALKAGTTGFTAEIAIADGDDNTKVATFNMSNMTTANQDYVLVIASYVGNKLVGLNVSTKTKTVNAGVTLSDSISLAKGTDANTTYKAFVWESLSSLKPLASSN